MKPLQVLLVFLALISLAACGGGKAAVTITLTPTTVSVYTTQNQQFTATVLNASSTAVTWEVNSVPFGDPTTVGSISAGGLYTAPPTVPNPATVTITAIPTADTTKSATATITVLLGANLAISPSSLSMDAGAQQTFVVTSNGGAAPTGIVYSLSCKTAGACGSVTTDGVYTAPLSPPAGGGNVILTASFTQGTGTFSTSATITILSSSQTTTGQYAFTLSGVNNGSAYHAAGSISLDGSGNITGGSEDINSQGAVTSVNITGGTYTFSSADGRIAANVQTSNGNVTWYMVLVNRSHGYIEYAGSGISASGTLALQDPTQFNLTSVNGNYAFRLGGVDVGSSQHLNEAGAFTAASGTLSSGLLDANTGGAQSSNQSVSGSLTAPSAGPGRGTLTISSGFATQTFAYYVVDGTDLKLVETDTSRTTAGDAVQQTGGPFTASSFHGNLAVVLNGASANGTLGIAGTFTLGNGAFLGGSIDRNDAGSFNAGGAQTVTGGTYTVTDATTGRTAGTIMLSGGTSIPVVVYPQSATAVDVLDASTTESAGGLALATSSGTGNISELNGSYGANFTGVVGTTPEDIVGTLSANGGGAFTGTFDITNGGSNTSLQSSPYTVTSTAASTTLKSGFANFSSVGFNMYIVDSTQVFFLENDNKGVLTGVMQLQ